MQGQTTERRTILQSALNIVSGKTTAIGDMTRVRQSMLTSLKREEKALDKIFSNFKRPTPAPAL